MKHLLLVALVATSFSGLANAGNGVYTSLKAGVSDNKFKDTELTMSATSETFHTDNMESNIYPTISTGLGYDFSQHYNINVRAEFEYTYRDTNKFYETTVRNSYNYSVPPNIDHKFKSQSLMFNGYYDFKNSSKFTPYIGVGVGITKLKKITSYFFNPAAGFPSDPILNSETDNLFTWSAGAGLAYAINNNVNLDLSYKYIHTNNYEFSSHLPNSGYLTGTPSDNKLTGKMSSQDYSLGIRYNF